jgi:hypothetical protein
MGYRIKLIIRFMSLLYCCMAISTTSANHYASDATIRLIVAQFVAARGMLSNLIPQYSHHVQSLSRNALVYELKLNFAISIPCSQP